MALRALIFDFDGLIIDTETAIYEAWREFYAEHGQPLDLPTWAQCVGSDFGGYDPMRDLEKATRREFDWSLEVPRIESRRDVIVAEWPVLDGVRERLAEAQALGLPCSIASSSPRSWVEPWLERLGLRSFFCNVTVLDDTGRAKPAPDLFQHAAGRLGMDPHEVLIFEDSLNGLRAATAAQMRCAVIPGPTTRHLDFAEAWAVLPSLAETTLGELSASFGES
jgi:putative hydrolase of the HAD superfamily